MPDFQLHRSRLYFLIVLMKTKSFSNESRQPTMPAMVITHVVAIVLTWTSAARHPETQLRAMVEEADAIWRTHGVAVVAPTTAGRPTPDADVRLIVTLASRAPRAATDPALGAIVFDHDNLPAPALTIDVAAVAATVAAARLGGRTLDRWPRAVREAAVGRALGRVLAHEIGHYLLASRAHAADGLMRAAFRGDELARPARAPFAVAARDLPRLRLRLAGRGGPRALAENAW
jgi:hypothetical protein